MAGVSSVLRCQAASSRRWLQWLAAPWLTVIFFLLTGLSVLAVTKLELPATGLMVAPFALLLINLGAAIASIPRFRRDLPLLVFHLALLLLVALLIVARLTYLQATTALAKGETFQGNLLNDDRGPLHGTAVTDLRFTNLGFSERYPEGSPFLYTYNQVSWQDQEGQSHLVEIRDDRPLVIDGYRIYTTRFRGYAPLFRWQDANGRETLGRVQLKNAVDGEKPPVNEWHLPDGRRAWAMLDFGDDSPAGFAPRAQKADRVNLGAANQPHSLVVRLDEERHSLRPGESIQLAGGTLTYLRLEAWMGYFIVYDPAQPWLIATVVVGVMSLVWFYTRQIFRRGRWDSDR